MLFPALLKADKADDSFVHCFQFVDYLTNLVLPHVPVDKPIQSAAFWYEILS
jgi:hypothetical protein